MPGRSFDLRWPNGFECPRCGGSSCSQLKRGKLYQCSSCRRQTSLIANTIFDNTKLPLTVWFRAMHVITQTKHGISSMELSRRLGVSVNAAWRIQHKLMQVMHERDRDGEHRLGDRGGYIQMDDAYLGGERNGGKRGRSAAGKTPFIAAVETDDQGRPQRTLLQPVKGFRKTELKKLRMRAILPGSAVVSDGLSCFAALASSGQVVHLPIKTGGGRSSSGLIQYSQTSRTTCSACIARFARSMCRATSPNSNGGSTGAST